MFNFTSTQFKATVLAATLFAVVAPSTANAASAVNNCSRWAGTAAMPWVGNDTDRQVARNAAFLLLDARSHGLNPEDYNARKLGQQLDSLLHTDAEPAKVARFNKKFTQSVVCYLQNVSAGRLNPHAVHRGVFLPRQKFNQHKALTQAFTDNSVTDLLLSAAPQTENYGNLRNSLSQLQTLAAIEGDLSTLRKAKGNITIGDVHPLISAVRERLVFLGDLAKAPQVESYEFETYKAVVRFQERHGLTPDGEIGRATLRALSVPMTHRVAQAELAMERIRWYPRTDSQRLVTVNIPQYNMQATANGETLESKVIVGKPGSRHTPMFAGPISRIEFSPYWYVPTSIARKAVVPRLRRDPGYLKRKGMEFRLPNGQLTQRVTASILDRAVSGSVRIQQRSGPSNALGKVKFILPNRRAIFMHDTANRKLFGKDKRALSYGCVRVQKPLALAKLLLADQAQWTGAAVEKAADYGKTVRANTTEKTMVMLQYLTAVSDDAGTMQFLPDVYKFDKAAKRVVARWSKPRLPATPDAALMARLQQADLG